MRDLNHQLKQLCRHNREGSYGTQVRRQRELTLMANQLHEIGYRGMNSHSPPIRTPEQRDQDHRARIIISREPGHEREQIAAVHLGR